MVTGLQNENTDETFCYVQTYNYISSEERDDSEWVFLKAFIHLNEKQRKAGKTYRKVKKKWIGLCGKCVLK
ncbi:hypothetical protein GCM10011346_36100 [Oceanobacillus neutriphilus]|uniref:Uncharacterized protein n=1 Tax=Oceanobacillus neutriphilus TaxID=531815 RepID=A0ABQ2NYW1_9BACI|nr:hypothetical protein GCM10011346_36100 [Oceanobacillus neutriphilus]